MPNYTDRKDNFKSNRFGIELTEVRETLKTTSNEFKHYFNSRLNFTITIIFIIPANSIGHTFVHCLIFFTAAVRWDSFHIPCD